MDDELLQDFLVEAGEILESLNEELVDLEQSPDDTELLNTVFRGFHTIKGGAGFLAIEAMVALCHRSEDIFNLLRNGERSITAELMDTILPVLDVLGEQFEALRSGEEVADADPTMLAALEKFTKPESEDEGATAAESSAPAAEAAVESPAEATPSSATVGGGEDITDDEFDQLLDALDGKDNPAAAPTEAAATAGSENITDDEFDALLDDLHGKGKFDSSNLDAEEKSAAVDKTEGESYSSGEMITEDEFDTLLDELHGKGKFQVADRKNAAAPAAAEKKQAAANTVKPEKKKAAAKEKPPAETSVRVDTSRLDDIMNMVGELVLVRNRITRLGERSGNEDMLKAVANLDLVTADLQLSVMKTRMQPIKKVFGRFPRVVRDIARTLKKEIRLDMVGEDTDLDKNLVEALADPLVHLVRNSLDHGIEMPDEREAAGKPREGTVVLAANRR